MRLIFRVISLVGLLFVLYGTYRSLYASNSNQVDEGKICINVAGFSTCPYFQRARSLAESLPSEKFSALVDGLPRDIWNQKKYDLQKSIPGAEQHQTSPMVWLGCGGQSLQFIGGASEFVDYAGQKGWSAGMVSELN
ncbi:hypothetical protein BJ742DRAFT_849427 [Cladochytrium replicatum]|nr:hypothetical protein BJ742DRAFT_849427 [Cladochytrium replicatum]